MQRLGVGFYAIIAISIVTLAGFCDAFAAAGRAARPQRFA